MATVGSHGKPEQRTFIDGSVKYADEQGDDDDDDDDDAGDDDDDYDDCIKISSKMRIYEKMLNL